MGPFQLVERIGRGGMGEVWRAMRPGTSEPVAVKVLTGTRPDRHALIRHEVRAVARLNHPGIVQLFDQGTHDGTPWIAMEYASEGTVADHRPRTDAAVRELVDQVLAALGHAHARGVIHRDLTLSNLLRVDGRVKLADFGIAHTDDGLHSHAGTPHTMAPEQIRRAPERIGPWTDLYSLGCVVFELLEGRPPFPTEPLQGHLTEPPPPLIHAPGWGAWVHELLQKTPESRPPSAAHARARLATVGTGGGTSATPTATSWATTAVTPDVAEVADAPRPPTPSRRTVLPIGASWGDPPPRPRWRPGLGLGLYGLRTVPLVGRTPQQAALWQALQDPAPTVQILVGPAGTGKSRLAAWLCAQAHEAGAVVWTARHSATGGSEEGVGAMLARGIGVHRARPDARADHVARWLYQRGGRPGARSGVLALTAAAVVDHPFGRMGDRLELMCEVLELGGAPVVVWLDDLHHGPDAVALAEHVLQARHPIHLVGTVRDDLPASPELTRLLDRVGTVPVGPLPEADRLELVEQILHTDAVLASRIAERTAGNPLFATQLIGDWVHRRLLVAGEHGFHLAPDADVPLPEALAAGWRRRLDASFPPGTAERRGLELAAALGIDVDHAEWGAACLAAGVVATPHVRDTLIEQNLATGPAARWSFVHGMLRETVLAQVSAPEELHAACAASLERIDVADRPMARWARHLWGAGALERAARAFLEAAHRASARVEFATVVALLEERDQVLDALDVGPGARRRAEACVRRCHALRQLGRWTGLAEHIDAVIEHGDPTDPEWRPLLSDAWCLRSMVQQHEGRHAEALASAEHAAALDAPGELPVVAYRITPLVFLGRLEDARTLGRAAVDTLHVLQHRGDLLRMLGQIELRLRRPDEALPYLERALACMEQTGDPTSIALASGELGILWMQRRQLDIARAQLERAVEAGGGPRAAVCVVPMANLAVVAALDGRWRDGLDQASAVLARAERSGWAYVVSSMQFVIWACTTDVSAQDARFDDMHAAVEKTGVADEDFLDILQAVCERRAPDAPGPDRVTAWRDELTERLRGEPLG